MRLIGFLLGACALASSAHAESPVTFSIPPALLERNAALLKNGDASLKPALDALVKDSDKALKQKPLSVMDKALRPASGDTHDYFSFGIYWWPDPSKPDGLPYIQKDGQRNPASREGVDATAFASTNHAVATLGLAYFFTGKDAYAEKATELTRVWYLNEATRMNPNMNHAQAVPGKNDGRGVGLIEAEHLTDFMDGIAMIRSSAAWTDADEASLTKWLGDFYQWLRTSKNGLDQEKAGNNHGVYYDALASHLALYLGKKEEAKARLEKALVRRLDAQIEPDGKQPLELKRTISFSYTVFNLNAFLQLATLGESVEVDFWKHRGPKGQSLQAALDLLVPYADPEKPWDLGQQIKSADRTTMLPFFQQALRYEENATYRVVLEKYGAKQPAARWRLTR